MPTNSYGPNDNFHPENSHVVPALISRFHEATQSGADSVVIWGSGKAKREFLHVNDMAAACVHAMELDVAAYFTHAQPMQSHINVGTGVDGTIRELAETIARVTNYKGDLIWDTIKPDGPPQELLDTSRLKSLGWEASISLDEGLRETYRWFLQNHERIRS